MSYDPKKDFGAQIRFLQAIMEKALSHTTQLDSQANILIGISLALFAFSVTRVNTSHPLGFFVLIFFSALSAITGLYCIHPPKSMRFNNEDCGKESLFYNKNIVNFGNYNAYEKVLGKVIIDPKKVLHQYAIEIYMIYKNQYRPKRELFKLSRNFLLIGIILSFIIYIATSILY